MGGCSVGREFELKYRADAPILSEIREEFGEFITIAMETTYYDTPAGDLGRLHWTLRRRYENGISVCTVKTPSDDGGRGEWEMPCDDIHDAVASLVAMGAPEGLAELAKAGLEEVCAARFTRLAQLLDLPGAVAELALDEGLLLGGGKELPFAEVEVEHKSGSEDLTTAWAKALAERFRLVPEPKSKVQRALALAER